MLVYAVGLTAASYAVVDGVQQTATILQATQPQDGAQAQPKGGTYVLKNPDTGEVERTGRTKDLDRRAQEHARNPNLKDLDFDEDARTDSYPAQRGREQILHDKYNPPRNKIRPIRPDNPQRDYYLREGGKVRGKY